MIVRDLFRVTMILVFIQIALGGLLTFDFITWIPHAITGFIVLGLAIVTLIVAQTTKPPFRPLQGLSIGLVLAIVVQIILGFVTLNTGNEVIAWVHLLVAVGIYGMVVSGTFMSMRLNYHSKDQPGSGAGPQV
jgi:heme A synthase